MPPDESTMQNRLHPSVLSPPSPAHEPLARLLVWAAERGAVAPKLALDPADPRRFRAAAPIFPLEPIITLPQHLLMHAGTALNDPTYGPAFRAVRAEMAAASTTGPVDLSPAANPTPGRCMGAETHEASAPAAAAIPYSYWDSGGLSDRDLLCMLLIVERARSAASDWAPYIDILPETYDDPSWWDAPSLELLRGTRIARAVAAYRPGLERLAAAMRRLLEIYSQIQIHTGETLGEAAVDSATGNLSDRSVVASSPGDPDPLMLLRDWACSLEAARWARSAVWSRSFTVRGLRTSGGPGCRRTEGDSGVESGADHSAEPVDERRLHVCQVPVLDMIDHAEGCQAVWHTGPLGADDFVWMRREQVQQDTVLSNNYGSKDNQELLLAYGFVLRPNRHDYVSLTLARGSGGGDDGGGAQDEEVAAVEEVEDIQAAAEAVQRRLVAAALGLPHELRLTLDEPLPEQLLQATRIALCSGPRLYFAASEALAAQTAQLQQQTRAFPPREISDYKAGAADPSTLNLSGYARGADREPDAGGAATALSPDAEAASSTTTLRSGEEMPAAISELLHPYDAPSELRVLGTIVQQLESRLAALISSDQETCDILGLKPPPPPPPPPPSPSPKNAPGPPLMPASLPSPESSAVLSGLQQRSQLLPPSNWLQGVCSGDGIGKVAAGPGDRPDGCDVSSHPATVGADGTGAAAAAPAAADGRRVSVGHSFLQWLYESEVAAERLGLERHARMALAVVNGQRAVLTAALWHAQQRMAAVLQATCATAAIPSLCSETLLHAPKINSCGKPALELLLAPPEQQQMQRHQQQHATEGSALAADDDLGDIGAQATGATARSGTGRGFGGGGGRKSMLLPYGVAVRVQRFVTAGAEILRLPLNHCLTASSSELLVARLVLLATTLVLPSQQQQQQQQQQPLPSSPHEPHHRQEAERLSLGGACAVRCEGPQHQQVVVDGGHAATKARVLWWSEPYSNPVLLVQQLLRYVGPASPVRLMLPPPPAAWGGPQHRGGEERGGGGDWYGLQCLKLMEGTPAGFEYEETAMELQDDFNNFRRRLPSLSECMSRPAPVILAPAAAPAEGATTADAPGSAAVQSFLSAQPQSAFWLYCWAREVVERCSVEMEIVEGKVERMTGMNAVQSDFHDHVQQGQQQQQQMRQQGQQQRLHLVVPHLWSLPKELVSAVLRLECHEGPQLDSDTSGLTLDTDPVGGPTSACASSSSLDAPKPLTGKVVGLSSRLLLVVRSACPLRPGLLLHPGCLLTSSRDTEGLLAVYGPETLAVVAAATTAATAAGRDGSGSAAAAVPASNGPLSLPVHSLELLPGTDDPLRGRKMELAGLLGLGCQHYLGPGGRGRGLFNAALHLLSISADEDEEAAEGGPGSLWNELWRLAKTDSKADQRQQQQRQSDMPQPGSPVGTGPSACASSGVAPAAAANTAAPPAATLLATASDAPAADMQLLSAARRAVSLLGVTLPDSAASKAARKLLRRELMDAAKLMAAGGCGRDVDAGGVGKAGGESTRGTEGEPALAGVSKYRQMYGIVLDEWCVRLNSTCLEGAPGAARGGKGTKRCNGSSQKERSGGSEGKVKIRGGLGTEATVCGAAGRVPGDILEPSSSEKRHRKA